MKRAYIDLTIEDNVKIAPKLLDLIPIDVILNKIIIPNLVPLYSGYGTTGDGPDSWNPLKSFLSTCKFLYVLSPAIEILSLNLIEKEMEFIQGIAGTAKHAWNYCLEVADLGIKISKVQKKLEAKMTTHLTDYHYPRCEGAILRDKNDRCVVPVTNEEIIDFLKIKLDVVLVFQNQNHRRVTENSIRLHKDWLKIKNSRVNGHMLSNIYPLKSRIYNDIMSGGTSDEMEFAKLIKRRETYMEISDTMYRDQITAGTLSSFCSPHTKIDYNLPFLNYIWMHEQKQNLINHKANLMELLLNKDIPFNDTIEDELVPDSNIIALINDDESNDDTEEYPYPV